MRRIMTIVMSIGILFTLTACGKAEVEPEVNEWTRQGYFSDENDNLLTVMWMEEVDEPGWYVGLMMDELGAGCIIPQEGNSLHGNLNGWDESVDPLIVTVTEEGEDGLLLSMDDGESFHFKPYDIPQASIVVTINTEGWGYIAYAEGEAVPEIDPEYPSQSAYIGLAEPAVHTILAQPEPGNQFVKWTKNGEDFSTEPQLSFLLEESADYIAVFTEDPDWQNPVLPYVGPYQCNRASATVEEFGSNEAWISIEWASSAWELTNWVITGSMDPETLIISYDACSKNEFIYDDQGEVVSDESEYEEIPGTISFNEDGSFTWHRALPEGETDMVFERLS